MNAALALALLLAAVTGALVLFTWATARKVASLVPASGRMVEVPGAALHVHEQGSGPALLLVHGLAGQLAHYTYGVAGELAQQFRVVAVDRPGSGYSTRASGTGADLSTQAAALAALIDKLQLDRPVVVGHSLGGALALTLALEHPGRVSGLALVAPLTHLPEGVPQAFEGLTVRSPLLRRAIAWTLAVPASIKDSAAVLAEVFGPEAVPRDFPIRGGGLLSLRPSAYLSASSDLQALPITLPALEQDYGGLRIPVSVLFGRDDRILDWTANGQALVDKVPGARLELVEGGHMLPLTQPALTADFIRRAALDAARHGCSDDATIRVRSGSAPYGA
jgi:pimeloyl-ACP methyl ester carboxylesterase